MNNKNNNQSKFKGFYSFYSKDASGKTIKDERVFDNYDDYIKFMKEKGDEFFIEIKSFFDKDLQPVFGKFLGVINKGLDKSSKFINDKISETEKEKKDIEKSDIVSYYKKELELEKQKRALDKINLSKQKEELIAIMDEWKTLGNAEKVKELEDVIKNLDNGI